MAKTKNAVQNKATLAAPPGGGYVVVRMEDGRNFVLSAELAESVGNGLLDMSRIATVQQEPIPVDNWPGQP